MKAARALAVLLFLALVGAGAAAFWWLGQPLRLAAPTVELAIEPGTTPAKVAEGWVAAGVRTSPELLYQWFKWSGQARQIRAGSYEVTAGVTPRSLLEKMVRGDESVAFVRIPEGATFRQVRAELAKAEALRPTLAGLSDPDLMQAIGAPGVHPEGRFHPDTYSYSKGSSDVEVLRRAYRAMQRRLADAWQQRAADLPLKSADEALTLASIVEKETGVAADRGLVAGVFMNRLRIGMPLQTDPTVIYGLGSAFDGNLRKRDLQTDSPYNTYLRVGLPPTPIAMPSKASLLAAVNPTRTEALYFVARGDGSSEFSASLADHNRAVDRFQRRPAAAASRP
ncbi:endolytic transglycosylase MltG [Piscinibacter koreensis]|uniref:Endolytic murein transglycosylase n=1 Tax=Piscinibacter koreensis TaxID=2742824 RepID=A0A7Y6NRL4_9BURK|nr:endolytic transglycosylase MltG [Schlegelella koreensis]NUZ08038.1 endolytic transglycosylase MltG [Schlegelella koreensis]